MKDFIRETRAISHPVFHQSPTLFFYIGPYAGFSVNPLFLRGDKHETSPYNIATLFSKQLMRILTLNR